MEETTVATSLIHQNTPPSSASAPEIHFTQSGSLPLVTPSPSLDTALAQSPGNGSFDNLSNMGDAASYTETIIEALRSKDRLYVLKLGEMIENLITERRTRIELNPATSYQRMLVHRCSSYYNVSPETDSTTKMIFVSYRAESRIPVRRISELVPAEESAQPAFKIMRRGAQERSRGRHNSHPDSVIGEDADMSDVEPSETGSISARSNATGSSRKHLTIEEREAAYNEARLRIFKDLEEKEKAKDKDMSANSSTISLVSGSASTSGGRSSMGDMDDSASSAATESEWSGPAARDKRDSRRGGSAASSSRSYNHPNGSNSSRNSRATSPSYPTVYEGPTSPPFDPTYSAQGPPHGYIQYYYPQYPPVGQPGHYVPPYPYYPPYSGYPASHPQSPPHHSDPTSPSGTEGMYPPPPMVYPGQYWSPPLQSPPHVPQGSGPTHSHHSGPPPLQHSSSSQGHPVPQNTQYVYTTPGPYSSYTMPGYYPPPPPFQPGQQMYPPPPQMPGQPYYTEMVTPPESMGPPAMNGHNIDSMNMSRTSSRNSNGHTNGMGRRGAPRTRQSWSYGPGPAPSGINYGSGGQDIVGPRLSTRRPSGASTGSGSGSAGNRTPGDETSSTTHPLPARPDWAVGIRVPNPPHHHNNPHSRTMSPARMGGQHGTHHHHLQRQQPTLQATDFPPLSSAPEKKTVPVASGAWTNAPSTRSIITSVNPAASGSALVHYPNVNANPSGNQPSGVAPGTNGMEPGFERPAPRGNVELFNPKATPKKTPPSWGSPNVGTPEEMTKEAGKDSSDGNADSAVGDSTITDKLAGLALEDQPSPDFQAELERPPAADAPTEASNGTSS
ncbi:unnamed protein product [Somion occarium]|uniref:SUZ domain-containing protein n=1 Tax=Somion occarium TaxID=3059160 RepID=A0ABP1E3E5_9APHY